MGFRAKCSNSWLAFPPSELIPVPNLTTSEIAEVYSRDAIIPPSEWSAIDVSHILRARDDKGRSGALPWRRSRIIEDKMRAAANGSGSNSSKKTTLFVLPLPSISSTHNCQEMVLLPLMPYCLLPIFPSLTPDKRPRTPLKIPGRAIAGAQWTARPFRRGERQEIHGHREDEGQASRLDVRDFPRSGWVGGPGWLRRE